MILDLIWNERNDTNDELESKHTTVLQGVLTRRTLCDDRDLHCVGDRDHTRDRADADSSSQFCEHREPARHRASA